MISVATCHGVTELPCHVFTPPLTSGYCLLRALVTARPTLTLNTRHWDILRDSDPGSDVVRWKYEYPCYFRYNKLDRINQVSFIDHKGLNGLWK